MIRLRERRKIIIHRVHYASLLHNADKEHYISCLDEMS